MQGKITVGRIAIFLWIALICLIGLYYNSDPVTWDQGSFLESFASQFPSLFAAIAAVFLLPLYALNVLLEFVDVIGLSISVQVLTYLQLIVGAVYLFWLSGVFAKRFNSAQ